ncbi:hypothetical protein GLS40_04180 [Pseudooceanicola sp. 216_PA32_1]|jgi:hypothetical protein|uniref:Yip1 domain-containing protein n=1 Tax=Pseudooceanicola pacificus TaxID=2676438 RepID=A0A844W3C7_9RHOB|nr:YIP1 family protein [Pseudooceanicola pacificus]MWB77214.1 hypothetical protein [Pseudooceanicola pacificus]
MMSDLLRNLVADTVLRPRLAAKQVLGMAPGREAMLLALALIAVLNGAFYALALPVEAPSGLPLPAFVNAPVAMAAFAAALLLANVVFLTMSGKILGGVGRFDDLLAISVWLQALRLVLQVGVTVMALLSPGLGGMIAAIAGIWSIWILLNFVAEAHGFSSVARALVAFVIGVIGLAFVLSFMLALFGVAPPEGV